MSIASLAALAWALAPAVARADSPIADVEPNRASVEAPPSPDPWLYLDTPGIAPPLRAIAVSRATYAGSSASSTRPFGADLAHPGLVFEVGAEVGLASWLSLAASAYEAAVAPGGAHGAGVMAGLRVPVWTGQNVSVVLSGGGLREVAGDAGAWGRLAASGDFGRARLGATLHGEHVFGARRDSVDVMVMGGASYSVVGPLRAGVEYVAQDLEAGFDPEEAEGGVRHFVGPTGSLALLDRRLNVVAGPAFGLSRSSPPLVARLSVGYQF